MRIMKTIKTYTNDSDYLIKIIEKDGNFLLLLLIVAKLTTPKH